MKFYTNVHAYRDTIRATIIDNGKRKHITDQHPCDLFLPTEEETPYTTIDGNFLKRKNFASIIKKKEYIETYQEVQNYNLFGNKEYQFDYIRKHYSEGEYSLPEINIFNIDIEVASDEGFPQPHEAKWPINAITIKFNETYYVWGTGIFQTDDENIVYYQCEDEKALLAGLILFWNQMRPDIITGWNVKFFDIPYIINRIYKVIGKKEARLLSPWKTVRERSANIMGHDNQFYSLDGVSTLDYIDLYRKYIHTPRESYRLDFIGHVELGLQKITMTDATDGFNLYKTDFQRFIEYNIRDCEIVDKLDKKLKLLQLVIQLAYAAGINYEDVHSPVKMWEAFIHKYLDERNIKVPLKSTHGHKMDSMVGAYVKDPKTGFQDWVISFDVNSLYPSLIRTLNIGPETLRSTYDHELLTDLLQNVTMDNLVDESLMNDNHKQELHNNDLTLAANAVLFDNKKQSFMSHLVQIMFDKRVTIKKRMLKLKQEYERVDGDAAEIMRALDDEIAALDTEQMALKIALNSLYGAMGNAYFQFFSIENAEAITMTGQVAIRWVEKKMNLWLNKMLKTGEHDYIIASDTDSIYVNTSALVAKLLPDKSNDEIVESLNKMCNEVFEPEIDKWFQELCDILNVKKEFNWLKMKREVIANKGLWTAKKRYALNIFDEEGVRLKEPKLKVMGIECVRSSTPAPVREKLKTALKLILNNTEKELQDFSAEFKKEFKKLQPEDIAFPKSVNGLEKYGSKLDIFKKGTPLHCRGALLYNNLLREKKLAKKYEKIQNGEKIKYLYLKEPNPIRNNVISITQFLPEEFGITKYIDYDVQFEKAYAHPLKSVLETINWSIEKQMTLESFF